MLGLSKLHMYDFHYNHMRVKYPRPGQLRLLFMDTDSLAYAVQKDDIYRDMTDDAANRYYFSEYPFDQTLYRATNRKALGFFKDEMNSVHTQQFLGLRPKCYAFLCTSKVCNNIFQYIHPVEKKTAKGFKRSVKDAHLHFAHYLDALKTFVHISVDSLPFYLSTSHTLRTVHMCTCGCVMISFTVIIVHCSQPST